MTFLLNFSTPTSSKVAFILSTITGKSCPHLKSSWVLVVLGQLMKRSLLSPMVYLQERGYQTQWLSGHPCIKMIIFLLLSFPSRQYSSGRALVDVIKYQIYYIHDQILSTQIITHHNQALQILQLFLILQIFQQTFIINKRMSSAAQRRLLKDLKRIQNEAGDEIIASPHGNNLLKWIATIEGVQSTPWEGGLFQLRLDFSENYPNKPPVVKFLTEMFHPNIYKDGRICLDMLQNQWSPIYDVWSILTAIRSLLTDPNTLSPANMQASNMLRQNKTLYEQKVRELVQKSLQNIGDQDENFKDQLHFSDNEEEPPRQVQNNVTLVRQPVHSLGFEIRIGQMSWRNQQPNVNNLHARTNRFGTIAIRNIQQQRARQIRLRQEEAELQNQINFELGNRIFNLHESEGREQSNQSNQPQQLEISDSEVNQNEVEILEDGENEEVQYAYVDSEDEQNQQNDNNEQGDEG